jgi:hypothetical protein
MKNDEGKLIGPHGDSSTRADSNKTLQSRRVEQEKKNDPLAYCVPILSIIAAGSPD